MFNISELSQYWPFLTCGFFLVVMIATAAHMAGNHFSEQKKTVFYTRYSSIHQRGDSIDDQTRDITEYLDHSGIPYDGAIHLADKAKTGTTTNRKDFKRLMGMVENREVGLVVVDDLSRLTRSKNYGQLWDSIIAHGGRLISVLDNLDSDRDGDEMSAMIKGLMNNITNKLNGKRVRRGIAGRFLDPKGSAGSHPFGYRSEFCDSEAARKYTGVGPKPKKNLFIDEEQAKVVHEIFRLYAEEEWSLTKIARHLNEQGIPTGTRSQRINSDGVRYSSGWHKVLIRKMLMQRKYIGDWRWGQNIHTTTEEGKRLTRPAAPKDILVVKRADLVIIPSELWDKAQARLAKAKEQYGYNVGQKRRGKKHHYTEEYPTSPLGGLLFCAECGSRLHFVPKNGNQGPYYACPLSLSKGKGKFGESCGHRGYVHADRALEALSGYLKDHLLENTDWLAIVYAVAQDEIHQLQARAPSEAKVMEAKGKELERSIANITKAVESAEGASPEILVKRLQELEREKSKIDAELRQCNIHNAKGISLPTQEWIREQMKDLAGILADEPVKTAKLFRLFFGKVKARIVVAPGKKRGHPELEFTPNRAALFSHIVRDSLQISNTDDEISARAEACVTIPLAGCDKLDKLMPTIDAMRQEGVQWQEICAQLKIAKSWANRYYNRWKSLTQTANEKEESLTQSHEAI